MNPKILLDFIGELEAHGNYNAVYGNANSRKDLSAYSLAEISAMQLAHGKRTGSSAFGKYQFLRETLAGLKRSLGLSGATQFTPELQDRMAMQLLKQRGYDRWAIGRFPTDKFMDSLSMEWASLPYKTGKSYYDKDRLNHALTTRAEFKRVLKQVMKQQP